LYQYGNIWYEIKEVIKNKVLVIDDDSKVIESAKEFGFDA